MTDFAKAAADARQLLRGFRAFDDLAAAFDSVAQAQQTKAEAEAALASVRGEIDKAQAELAALRSACKKEADGSRQKTADAVKAAEKRAATLVADAERKVSEANVTATAMLASAKSVSDTAKREADEALVQRDAALRELGELEGRISNAKAEIKKLLG